MNPAAVRITSFPCKLPGWGSFVPFLFLEITHAPWQAISFLPMPIIKFFKAFCFWLRRGKEKPPSLLQLTFPACSSFPSHLCIDYEIPRSKTHSEAFFLNALWMFNWIVNLDIWGLLEISMKKNLFSFLFSLFLPHTPHLLLSSEDKTGQVNP